MESREALSTKELALINALDGVDQSQRNLAKSSGFSLGMTNLLLKRLVKKGYVKAVELNGRTLKYILTPRGFSEKVGRTYDFVLRSIRGLNDIRERIRQEVSAASPADQVVILGRNELAELAGEVAREMDGTSVRVQNMDDVVLDENSVVLLCDPHLAVPQGVRNVIELSTLLQAPTTQMSADDGPGQ